MRGRLGCASPRHLPRIVNGKRRAPLKKRPFEFAFGPEKVEKGWGKVGACPATRAGLSAKKVRHEAAEVEGVEDVSALADGDAGAVAECTERAPSFSRAPQGRAWPASGCQA